MFTYLHQHMSYINSVLYTPLSGSLSHMYGKPTQSNVTIEESISQIEEYMVWYRDKHIKMSLGGLSPMEYRKRMGIVA